MDFLSFSIWQTPTFLFLFNSRFLQVSYWSLSLSHLITVKSVLSLVLNHLTHHSTTELKYTPSLIDSEGRVPLDFCVSRNWDSNAMTLCHQSIGWQSEWMTIKFHCISTKDHCHLFTYMYSSINRGVSEQKKNNHFFFSQGTTSWRKGSRETIIRVSFYICSSPKRPLNPICLWMLW